MDQEKIISRKTTKTTQQRKALLSFLLSIIKPGLGQMYNGQLVKGVILFFSAFISNILVVLLIGFYSDNRFINILVLFLIVLIPVSIALEASIQSKKIGNNFTHKRYNRWYYYLSYFVILGYIFGYPVGEFVRNNVLRAHKVPTTSMEDTVLHGDYFITNLLAYNSKKLPQKNDLIIFKYCGIGEKDYIKRIVGISGQTVKIIQKDVYVDNEKQESPPGAKFNNNNFIVSFPDTFEVSVPAPGETILVEALSPRDFLFLYHIVKQENPAVEAAINLYVENDPLEPIQFSQFDNWQMLQRVVTHVQDDAVSAEKAVKCINTMKINGEEIKEYTVKNHNYFVLGDNRNNSLDSRHFGFVNLNAIKGKTKLLYMSVNTDAPFWHLTEWIRWGRIGKPIH